MLFNETDRIFEQTNPKTLGKSKGFVLKWSNRSNFEDEKRSGRPKKFTKTIEKKVQRYLKDPHYGSIRATKRNFLHKVYAYLKEP